MCIRDRFWSAGYPMQAPNGFAWTSGPVLCTAQDQVIVWEFTLESTWTISTEMCIRDRQCALPIFCGGNAVLKSKRKVKDLTGLNFGRWAVLRLYSEEVREVTAQKMVIRYWL